MSWLETEIREQPDALARLLDRGAAAAQEAAALFRRPDVRYVLIASRGSSANVARYAQYVFGRAHRVPVMFATPSLYTIYEQPPRLDGALVVGISQSGASPDIVAVVAEARAQGRPTLAVVNDVASPLAGTADVVLPLEAGVEHAVAATKTYVNSLGAVASVFAAVDGEVAAGELARMPEALAAQIERSSTAPPQLAEYRDAVGLTVVARGVNYGTGYEIALKIRELSGLVTEAYSPADLMHGPIAAIQPGWPVVVVAPDGPMRASVEEVLDPLAARGARLAVVSDVPAALQRAHTQLPLVAGVPEWLSPLTAVVPGQLTALGLTELRGLDLDRPSGLQKVTLTR